MISIYNDDVFSTFTVTELSISNGECFYLTLYNLTALLLNSFKTILFKSIQNRICFPQHKPLCHKKQTNK